MKLSTRLAIAMVALVLFAATSIGWLAYRTIGNALVPPALDRIEAHARLLAIELQAQLQGVPADVAVFRTGASIEGLIRSRLNGGVDPIDGTPEAAWQARLASRIVALVASKPIYHQFRLVGIADGGREILRVERVSDSAARLVLDGELRRAGDAGYFAAAAALPADEVYVSPVELERDEQGGIAIPPRPLLHVATPLHTGDGKPFGIVVITVDMQVAFAGLRKVIDGGISNYVINGQGDYLVHPDRTRELAYLRRAPDRLQDEFPELKDFLGAPASLTRIVRNPLDHRLGVAAVPVRLANGPWAAVVEVAPYRAIMAPAFAVRDSILLGATAAVLAAIALAIWLARSLTRPLAQMTGAVETFMHRGPVTVPTDAGGEIGVLAQAFAHLVSDIRDKTVALEREIAQRARIFDTSLDLILVVDRRGSFIQVSPSSLTILGYQPNEMIGRSAVEFLHGDDLESTRNEMRMARRGRNLRNFETRYIHESGRIVTLAWTGVWSEPEQQHFFIGRDMTEQKFAQEMFRLAVEACPNGMVMFDRGNRIVLVNNEVERLFGYRRDELIGQPIGRLVPRGLDARQVGGEAKPPDQPAPRHHGHHPVGVRKDGTQFPVELGVNPINVRDSVLVLGVIVDISERLRNDRLKDEFVSTVSHELRTPLTSIAGSLGLLTGGAGGQMSEPTMRLLRIAHKNSERLVRLINDILDIEKIESGKIVFNLTRLDVVALIEQAIEGNRGFAESFGVQVRLETPTTPAFVRADPDRFVQLVTNLLSNACKFSPRGEEVVVAAEERTDTVRITVRDHGPGIPEDFKPRIFEKFAQADATDARQKGGTGLGLSIVKQIVTLLGGTIGFEAAPAGGTIFHVDLPRWELVAGVDATGDAARILICDDDPAVANVFAERLTQAGLPCEIALNGRDALVKARARPYEAILVDLTLPDCDGISLIQELRGDAQHQNTPIVVISADAARGRDDIRSSSLDVLDWLTKPIDISSLVAVLSRPLARRAAQRPCILHIDDDSNVLAIVAEVLGTTCMVTSVPSIEEARRALTGQRFDFAVLDLLLSQASGLDLLPALRNPEGNAIPVILYSAKAANGTNSAQVHAALNKSRGSIDHLITTLRNHLASCQVVSRKEVA